MCVNGTFPKASITSCIATLHLPTVCSTVGQGQSNIWVGIGNVQLMVKCGMATVDQIVNEFYFTTVLAEKIYNNY